MKSEGRSRTTRVVNNLLNNRQQLATLLFNRAPISRKNKRLNGAKLAEQLISSKRGKSKEGKDPQLPPLNRAAARLDPNMATEHSSQNASEFHSMLKRTGLVQTAGTLDSLNR